MTSWKQQFFILQLFHRYLLNLMMHQTLFWSLRFVVTANLLSITRQCICAQDCFYQTSPYVLATHYVLYPKVKPWKVFSRVKWSKSKLSYFYLSFPWKKRGTKPNPISRYGQTHPSSPTQASISCRKDLFWFTVSVHRHKESRINGSKCTWQGRGEFHIMVDWEAENKAWTKWTGLQPSSGCL